jgi:hypothetical protein
MTPMTTNKIYGGLLLFDYCCFLRPIMATNHWPIFYQICRHSRMILSSLITQIYPVDVVPTKSFIYKFGFFWERIQNNAKMSSWMLYTINKNLMEWNSIFVSIEGRKLQSVCTSPKVKCSKFDDVVYSKVYSIYSKRLIVETKIFNIDHRWGRQSKLRHKCLRILEESYTHRNDCNVSVWWQFLSMIFLYSRATIGKIL